ALARQYRKRISHVHCKDVRAAVRKESEAKDWSFLDSVIAGVYTVPGDGMVDYVAVFKELPGYSGWVVVEAEQDPKKAEPAKYAKLGYDNLVRYLKQGGLS
ncbi:MAG TPA: TIM barrel protein, partial [Nordella sp.]|nr:TIM barrel protein [Nordella sp.]